MQEDRLAPLNKLRFAQEGAHLGLNDLIAFGEDWTIDKGFSFSCSPLISGQVPYFDLLKAGLASFGSDPDHHSTSPVFVCRASEI